MQPDTSFSPKRLSFTPADDDIRPFNQSRIGDMALDQNSAPPTGFGSIDALDPSSPDFASLAEIGQFVDKSHALSHFLETPRPVHLLLRPRRSGKTILLTMFRDYFECTTSDQKAHRKQLFQSNNLEITKHGQFEGSFGNFPVLYLDFANVIGSSMEVLEQAFKNHIIQVVRRMTSLPFFKNKDKLRGSQLTFLDEFLNGTILDLSTVLYELTDVLHALHGNRVIVLIDEYDTPTSYTLQYDFFPKANEFFRKVFSTLLKNNGHLQGALIIGILPVARAGWLSGLNNISVFPLGQTSKYSTACMFTEEESRRLYIEQAKRRKLLFSFEDLRKWYDGYSALGGIKLFNPWSIINALITGDLAPWWNKSGYDSALQSRISDLLYSDDDFRGQCQTLLGNGEIVINIDTFVAYASLPTMSTKQLWTLLYYAGYLTHAYPISPSSSKAPVRIPNSEIQCEFREWIQEDLTRRLTQIPHGFSFSVTLFENKVNGMFSEFATAFGNFVLTKVPQRVFGSEESVHQEYVFAYFSSVADSAKAGKWTSKMEVVAGDGRVDIIFHDDTKGLILELKCLPHPKQEGYREDVEGVQLSHQTNEVLQECDTRLYWAYMPQSVTTIYEYGIAFLGPFCGVEARAWERGAETWVQGRIYTSAEDEERRMNTYRRQKQAMDIGLDTQDM